MTTPDPFAAASKGFAAGVYQCIQVPNKGVQGQPTFVAQSGEIKSDEQLEVWVNSQKEKIQVPDTHQLDVIDSNSKFWFSAIPGSPTLPSSEPPVRETGATSDPHVVDDIGEGVPNYSNPQAGNLAEGLASGPVSEDEVRKHQAAINKASYVRDFEERQGLQRAVAKLATRKHKVQPQMLP